MSNKFIPSADLDFKKMATNFAQNLSLNPSRYHIPQEDADALVAMVQTFETALQENFNPATRNKLITQAKVEARAAAEEMIRRLAQMIRANPKIDPSTKLLLNIKERAERTRKPACPMEPPRLTFVKALHVATAASPMHELKFSAVDSYTQAKPTGATRLELFVDLIAPDAPIPAHPGATPSGRPWYLRSFTKSPIVLEPPMAKVPMRVVYWARWADNTGNVGPFSSTVVGWTEGGNVSSRGLSFGALGKNQIPLMEVNTTNELTDERTYEVAVIEAHYMSIQPMSLSNKNVTIHTNALVDQSNDQPKQLQAPEKIDAA